MQTAQRVLPLMRVVTLRGCGEARLSTGDMVKSLCILPVFAVGKVEFYGLGGQS